MRTSLPTVAQIMHEMLRWEVDRAVNDGIELTGASTKWYLANARCSVAEGLSSRAAGPRNGETLASAFSFRPSGT